MATIQPLTGLIEAFNNTIGKLLKKFILKSQRDKDDKLGECLGLSHNDENPDESHTIFFVYGCEAILPLEIQIPSL